jgi:hypothetical protein
MSGVIVTMKHVRAVRLGGQTVSCAPGIRAWCDRHGIDLRQFTAHGLPVEQVEAIDDAYAQRAAALARAQAAGDQGDDHG